MHLAGLWKMGLPENLLWTSDSCPTGNKRNSGVAPSWPWASVDGGIYFNLRTAWSNVDRPLRPRVLEATIEHYGDPFGQIIRGSIIIQGLMLKVILSPPNEYERFNFKARPATYSRTLIYWDYQHAAAEYGNIPLFFLVIAAERDNNGNLRPKGLMLHPTNEHRGQYHRVGVIKYAKPMGDFIAFLRSTERLEEGFYRSFDPELGYEIEII
jgi:hypothetical protein